MSIEYLSIVIGCFVGLAGWLLGRDRKISSESQWKGEVNAKLDSILGIRDELGALRSGMEHHAERITFAEGSVKSAHKRIDLMEAKLNK